MLGIHIFQVSIIQGWDSIEDKEHSGSIVGSWDQWYLGQPLTF